MACHCHLDPSGADRRTLHSSFIPIAMDMEVEGVVREQQPWFICFVKESASLRELPPPTLPHLELVWRTIWKRCVCSVEIATREVGTVIVKERWWGLLVLGKTSGQCGIVGQSHQLQAMCREKGLNYCHQILVLVAMTRAVHTSHSQNFRLSANCGRLCFANQFTSLLREVILKQVTDSK